MKIGAHLSLNSSVFPVDIIPPLINVLHSCIAWARQRAKFQRDRLTKTLSLLSKGTTYSAERKVAY
jgi:hypothetical protein